MEKDKDTKLHRFEREFLAFGERKIPKNTLSKRRYITVWVEIRVEIQWNWNVAAAWPTSWTIHSAQDIVTGNTPGVLFVGFP